MFVRIVGMYVCMIVWLVCMYASMVGMNVCLHGWYIYLYGFYVSMLVWLVCMYACIVRMYVCSYGGSWQQICANVMEIVETCSWLVVLFTSKPC